MSQTAAYRFIHVAERYDDKRTTVARLGPTALYELAAPATPLEVRIEIEHRITAGELVTASDIKRLKDEFAEIKQLASEKTAQLTAAEQSNLDLVANAHRVATEESEKKHGAEIESLKKRVAAFEAAANASIEANPDDTNVVAFVPKDDGEPITEGDALAGGAEIDIADHGVGAHAIHGALSIVDLAQTTPEAFWAIFGTPGRKPGALKLIKGVVKTLNAIKKGMPK
jgi:hypothetical protein